MNFIERLNDHLFDKFKDKFNELAIVFPSRRAGQFFRKGLQKLSQKINKPLWSPEIFSLDEFVLELSTFGIIDTTTLLFKLFNIYREMNSCAWKDFGEFYSWGNMILSDFDEIDKHLIDTGKLFERLKAFRDTCDLDIEESNSLYAKYTGFWSDMEGLYNRLTRKLKSEGYVYGGMAYRNASERLKANPEIKWEKVIFAGFNAFNKAEEEIIKNLLKREKAEIYWDLDPYFTNDRSQEAGDFFRRNRENLELTDFQWMEDSLLKEKEIHIIGVPTKVSQARIAGYKLKELNIQSINISNEKTAIVLPDETMLFPLLNTLPPQVEKLNVTMGYSLRYTSMFNLISYYLDLHVNSISGPAYYYKDVMNILRHPAVLILSWEGKDEINRLISERNLIYVTALDLKYEKNGFLYECLFSPWQSAEQSIEFLMNLLAEIIHTGKQISGSISALEMECAYQFHIELGKLLNILTDQKIDIKDVKIFRRLLDEVLSSAIAPFSGEPLSGLQIMGMLETQALDFENLFILSMNEGVMPSGKTKTSFIPHEIKVSLSLPTHRERDSLFAYHFYRLLKRAKKVFLFYLNQTDELGKCEKSRFIEQLKFEYRERNKSALIIEEVAGIKTEKKPVLPIKVKKTKETVERLLTINERGFSPSLLYNYISCPLKFYFQKIMKLEEEDEPSPEADAGQFGSIIHDSVESLYAKFGAKPITGDEIEEMKASVGKLVRKAYVKRTKIDDINTGDINTGKNRLNIEIINKLVLKFLDIEKRDTPFSIISLERKYEKNVSMLVRANNEEYPVSFYGIIDRIDKKNEFTRIIDYKTGGGIQSTAKDMESLIVLGSKKKEIFQLLFYLYLWASDKKSKESFPVKLGIYPFRELSGGVKFIKVNRKDIFSYDDANEFGVILERLLTEIFDLSVPFEETKDEYSCRFCSFVSFCGKNAQSAL